MFKSPLFLHRKLHLWVKYWDYSSLNYICGHLEYLSFSLQSCSEGYLAKYFPEWFRIFSESCINILLYRKNALKKEESVGLTVFSLQNKQCIFPPFWRARAWLSRVVVSRGSHEWCSIMGFDKYRIIIFLAYGEDSVLNIRTWFLQNKQCIFPPFWRARAWLSRVVPAKCLHRTISRSKQYIYTIFTLPRFIQITCSRGINWCLWLDNSNVW